ncbi:hypothetical protein A3K86_17850 [Photobacterium jeanii]|uniref:HTH cro/C1-type domain-containing protein n=1 Tax=Photobacterium jeanii TaxID=858640 RepID=A0A178K184_9GAMM|nr:hypothetical protein [Photobacterium jeanii]OAN10857.1 hypothetical protein A3K86_17850 [Photobacterium jeanii]PST90372.1 hypothetical protein C9I91_06945 [Photobacterium jeanii]
MNTPAQFINITKINIEQLQRGKMTLKRIREEFRRDCTDLVQGLNIRFKSTLDTIEESIYSISTTGRKCVALANMKLAVNVVEKELFINQLEGKKANGMHQTSSDLVEGVVINGSINKDGKCYYLTDLVDIKEVKTDIKSQQYHSIIILKDQKWAFFYGHYDRNKVEEKVENSFSKYTSERLQIITTDNNQKAIDDAIADQNELIVSSTASAYVKSVSNKTLKQIADYYGCTADNLQVKFHCNKKQFQIIVHGVLSMMAIESA